MASSGALKADYQYETGAKFEDERAQFALAEQAAKFGYWRQDLAANHLTWSPGLYRLLGADPAKQKPDVKWFCEQIIPEDASVLTNAVARAIKRGSSFSFRSRIANPAARTKIIDTHGEVEMGADGRVIAITGVCCDVTERAEAEAASLAKSTFLANMSHELRTPLNAILGFADIMRKRMFGPVGAPRYEEYVNLIHESGELLLDLISDILDMAKIEAGKLELNFEPVDLRLLAGDCALLLEERAAQRGITLKTELPAGPATIEGDPRALKQILLNLMSNAVKFTLSGGTVTVRLRTDENGHAFLEVEDNGIGIPASELPRLGRPFEQACMEPALAKGGTGLGLALVRALAEKHGGQLRIESEEGSGTTASIELPLSQANRAAA